MDRQSLPAHGPATSSEPAQGRAQIVLILFVTDASPSSSRARAQLERLSARSDTDVDLTVIDTLERPEAAEAERVVATPTLIRHFPRPRRKIVGDLSDWPAVMDALDLADGARP